MTKKEKIEQYIIDHICLDNYKDCDWVRKDNEIMAIRDIVKVEKKDEWDDMNPVPAVKSWLQGVPSALECSHSTFRQAQLIKEWMSISRRYLAKDNDIFIADLYYSRIAIELVDYWKRFEWGRILNPPMRTKEREELKKQQEEEKKKKEEEKKNKKKKSNTKKEEKEDGKNEQK